MPRPHADRIGNGSPRVDESWGLRRKERPCDSPWRAATRPLPASIGTEFTTGETSAVHSLCPSVPLPSDPGFAWGFLRAAFSVQLFAILPTNSVENATVCTSGSYYST